MRTDSLVSLIMTYDFALFMFLFVRTNAQKQLNLIVTCFFDLLMSWNESKIDLKPKLIKILSLLPRGQGMQRMMRMTKGIRKIRAHLMAIN